MLSSFDLQICYFILGQKSRRRRCRSMDRVASSFLYYVAKQKHRIMINSISTCSVLVSYCHSESHVRSMDREGGRKSNNNQVKSRCAREFLIEVEFPVVDA